MKRTKILFIGIALLISVSAALATRPDFDCRYSTQYSSASGAYAGEFGNDYICLDVPVTCTWYQPSPILQPNWYAPCRDGAYTPID